MDKKDWVDGVKSAAIMTEWSFASIQPDKNYLRFSKGEKIIDVWFTGTIRYIAQKNGKAQHYRDNDLVQIEDLFELLGCA